MMRKNAFPQKFTLFRFPLAHSLSPTIHQAFAAQFNLPITYTQTESPIHALKDKIAHFRRDGGVGANITMPLKEEAYQLCQHHTSRAKIAQSVNTLFWQNDSLWGDNTDGIGFIRDITQNLKHSLENKIICILGAGGAAAGIIHDIAQQNPKHIFICNRTIARAQALNARFHSLNLSVITLETLNKMDSPDWIISTTPFSATHLLFPLEARLLQNTYLYELCYAKSGETSALSQCAKASGASGIYDGLGMLVEQAAISFSVWQHGLFPQTQDIIANLRKNL